MDGLHKPSNTSNPTPKPNDSTLELYTHVEKLLSMLNDPHVTIGAMWDLMTQEICPRVLPEDARTPYSLHFASKSLLRKLIRAHQHHSLPEGLPSVSEIARIYACMSLLSPRSWAPVLDIFFTPQKFEELVTHGEQIAEDLLETWRAILTHSSYSGKSPSEMENVASRPQWVLPKVKHPKARRDMRNNSIEHAFASLHPRYQENPLPGMASRAIITFAMLTDERVPRIPAVEQHPFIRGISDVIATSGMDSQDISKYISAKALEMPQINKLELDWARILPNAINIAKLSAFVNQSNQLPSYKRANIRSERIVMVQLSQARALKDLDTVSKLWSDVQKWEKAPQDLADGEPKACPISIELGNNFITAFTVMNKPMAVEVWNFMRNHGVEPTAHTWHAMLEGCKISRDSASLLGVWAKMLESGMRPDVSCWTTLISGLMGSGDLEGGIRALHSMKVQWETAAKSYLARNKLSVPISQLNEIDGVIKPTTAVINAAVVNLLRKNKIDAASQVLSFAGDIGIRPDNVTYNTILRSLVRKRDDNALHNLLVQMEKQGVRGDIATFTTLLESALADSHDSSPEELTKIVDELFEEMKTCGINANEQTCSAIINSILRRAPSIDYLQPAEHVVSKMAKMGLKPSAHIQTMFVDFHFKQPSPKLDTIAAMLDSFKTRKLPRDHIFWDRVIEGYSGVGDTVHAVQSLRQSQKEGSRPGYAALNSLLHALCNNEEIGLARQLVVNIANERGGPPSHEAKGVDAQHRFWNSVEQLGLIDESLEAMLASPQ